MKKFIIIKLQIDGIHCWPNCNVDGANYLKFPHRHVFFIKCVKKVDHNDRDIEIIDFKKQITVYLLNTFPSQQYNTTSCDFSSLSCESICELLINRFYLHSCEVLEDNENGAYLES
jgi:hypothetical protein